MTRFPQAGIGRPLALRGPQGPQGPQGVGVPAGTTGQGITFNGSAFVGDARPVDVWNSHTSPASVTDWGPIINALVLAGHHYLWFGEHAFPFSTQIDITPTTTGIQHVLFEGPDVGGWSNETPNPKPAYLLWKGSGVTSPINAHQLYGLAIRGLGLYWDNSSGNATFNGFVSPPTVSLILERCHVAAFNQGNQTAKACISLDGVVRFTVRECAIACAQWGIRFCESNATSDVYGQVAGNIFDSFTVAALGNLPDGVAIDGWNVFELGAGLFGITPAVIDSDISVNSSFTFKNNWLGDSATSGGFKQRAANFWRSAIFEGNDIEGILAPVWDLQGQADSIKIGPQHWVYVSNTGSTNPIVDLGATTGVGNGAYKAKVDIDTASWHGTAASELVANTDHHGRVTIDGADSLAVTPYHPREGRRYLFYRAGGRGVPSIAIHAGAGVNGIGIHGLDDEGYIYLSTTTGTTGLQADITFAEPIRIPDNAPTNLAGFPLPIVKLTPMEVPEQAAWSASVGPGNNSAGHGEYFSIGSGGLTHLTGWSLGFTTAPPNGKDLVIAYSIVFG